MERVAWSDAKSGDLVSCERALGQVEGNFNHANPEDGPDWVYWLNCEEIDVMAGRCYTELKQPDRAEALLRKATSGYDDALIRENSLYLSRLAEDPGQQAGAEPARFFPARAVICVIAVAGAIAGIAALATGAITI